MEKTKKSMKNTQFFSKYGIYILFVGLIIVLMASTPSFRTIDNALNILVQTAINAVAGIGMTLVIITGGMDVSIGAVMAVAAASGVGAIKLLGMPAGVGILVILAVGLLFGLINGASVAYLKMPPFLVTLATQGIARGLTLVVSGGKSWYDLPEIFNTIGKENFLGIPILVWILIVLCVVGHLLLNNTTYGRKVIAVGGNLKAAKMSGIHVNRVQMSVYIILGVICGIAAIMTISRIGSSWPAMGTSMEFTVIAGVVVGGTSLSGGKGSILGSIVGAFLLGVISNALNLWGIPAEWQDVARGVIIFLAVMLDAAKTRNKKQ